MTTLTQLLADVNDLLNDSANTQVSEAQKIRYINRAQHAMWPKVYRVASDITTVLVADQYEYAVPVGLAEGIMLSVDFETSASSSDFWQGDGRVFDLLPSASYGQTLVLKSLDNLPGPVGSAVRFTAAVPLTALATGTDVYTGPSYTDELPVLYAMAMATARDYERRIDYERFSTTQALNGVLLGDVMRTSEYWLRQFQILLDQVKMPFPSP